jgi:WD40 repeat protein
LWNARNLSLLKTITHSSKVVDIKIVSNTNTLVIGGSDRSVTLVDLDTTEKSKPFVGLQNALSSVAVSPDRAEIVASDIYGGIVAWSKSGTQLWKVPTRVYGFTPSDNILGVNHSLVFSFDGETVISGLRNGTIRHYKALTGEEIKQDSSLNNYTEKLVVSHNSNFVLSQNNMGGLKMWDLRNGKLLYQLTGTMKQGGVFSLTDQYFAVAADAVTVKVFETTSGNEVFTFDDLQNIQAIQFIQNDRFLVAGNDPTMRIWSLISGQEIKTIKNFNGIGCTVVYDLKKQPIFVFTKYNYVPNGSEQDSFCAFQKVAWMKAVSVNETNSNIAYGGNSKLGFTGPGIGDKEMDGVNLIIIEKVAINAEKTLLAVAFDDHTIGIWDTATRQKIMQLYGHDNSVTDLQFSADGTFLLSSSLDGTIRIWGIP